LTPPGPGDAPADRSADGATALRLVAADPSALERGGEPGLVVLDTDLPLDAATVLDVLAQDASSQPVVVLLVEGEPAAALGRIGRVLASVVRSRPLLDRLYASTGLDLSQAPRIVLLSRRFPDEVPALLDLMGDVAVSALEYRVIDHPDGSTLLDVAAFHRTGTNGGEPIRSPAAKAPRGPASASSNGAGPPAAPAQSQPSAPTPTPTSTSTSIPATAAGSDDDESGLEIEAGAEEALMDQARSSIRSLSDQITEEIREEGIRFLVDGEPLALLALEHGVGVHLGIFDGEEDRFEHLIQGEESLHAGLNALFDHYFQHIDAQL